MPLIDNDVEVVNFGGSHFGYSGVKPSSLESTEYTLASVIFDCSGSMQPFSQEVNSCMQRITETLMKSPRVDNLLLRTVRFGSKVEEFHGFKPLSNCNVVDYENVYKGMGMTALLDAIHNGVKATEDYALALTKSDYSVNAVVFVVTDDDENNSTLRETDVAKAIKDVVGQESIESVKVILITANDSIDHDAFARRIGAHQHINVGNFTPQKLAKLAEFVSKSVSSTSQALGTGGPSQNLTF